MELCRLKRFVVGFVIGDAGLLLLRIVRQKFEVFLLLRLIFENFTCVFELSTLELHVLQGLDQFLVHGVQDVGDALLPVFLFLLEVRRLEELLRLAAKCVEISDDRRKNRFYLFLIV